MSASLPPDYDERVYAGVLGKIIGVYLGRPFEGWTHERILRELGPIRYYVHERLGKPLVVTDDDISGTFTFLRALEDRPRQPLPSPADVGRTWLNYLIEKRTILWWGGMGHSTEHTAYLRLKHGIEAPRSGSAELNGKVVSEQIGAQIFIDGWALLCPGEPERAAELARIAASVSHDGEAVFAAQALAAMEALAFTERRIDALLDAAAAVLPPGCIIAAMLRDLREWAAECGDWERNRARLDERYGYHRYGGNCHVVPNHGLILLALLHGGGDFSRSLSIVNSGGWDTDCNSGNLGCLLGIRGGLAGLEDGPDWRGPVADRLYLSCADGSLAITDAVRESVRIADLGRRLHGLPPAEPTGRARYHFSFPGSVQGWQADDDPECRDVAAVANMPREDGEGRALAIRLHALAEGRAARVATATFIPPDALDLPGYALLASPTLHPGQRLEMELAASASLAGTVRARLYVALYAGDDTATRDYGPAVDLSPGHRSALSWRIPETGGCPIYAVGVELSSGARADGRVDLLRCTWEGEPEAAFPRPGPGRAWKQAWVQGVDRFESTTAETYRLIQDEGRGLLLRGGRDWRNYRFTARIAPHMAEEAGIAVRSRGMRQGYALLLCRGGTIRLLRLFDGEQVLAESPLHWRLDQDYLLTLACRGASLDAWCDQDRLFQVEDPLPGLETGGVALVIREGRMAAEEVAIWPG